MLLAIPYHPSTPADYADFSVHLRKKGTNPSHSLVVVCRREHEDEAFTFAHSLSSSFHRHFLAVIPDLQETMLDTSNRMFKEAVKFHFNYATDGNEMADPPMAYFDVTWRPTKSRWLDELQSDYFLKGAPTIFANFAPQEPGPPAPTGPLVLAKDYTTKSKLLDFIPQSLHWRNYLAWEMSNLGVACTAVGPADPAYIRPFTPRK
jgi:hypothetical protein